jgi:hypothetical protein
MKTIEFEAITFQNTIRIPDTVPDGIPVRITLFFDDKNTNVAVDLDPDVFEYLNKKCDGNPEKLRGLVNDWLRKNIEIARSVS